MVTESGPRPHEEPTVTVNTVRKMEASNLGVIREEMCFGRTFDVRPPARLKGDRNEFEKLVVGWCATTCWGFFLSEKVAVAARSLKEKVIFINTID
jgi:hypothetical protein